MARILLINPIARHGHLDSYARLYSRAFLELGHSVALVAESDGGVPGYLERLLGEAHPDFSFTSFEEGQARYDRQASLDRKDELAPDQANQPVRLEAVSAVGPPYPPLLTRLRRVWAHEGTSGLVSRVERRLRRLAGRVVRTCHLHTVAQQALGPIRFARRVAYRGATRTAIAAERGLNRTLKAIVPVICRGGRSVPFHRISLFLERRAPEAGRLMFEPIIRAARGAVLLSEEASPDLACFLYMDLMAERPANIATLDEPGAWPWIGVLFHPRLAASPDLRIEGYFASRRTRGAIFLVPDAVSTYQQRRPDLHFALVPDVADLETPNRPHRLAQEMRRRASGRTIVLQIGTIAPHKGIITLLEVIARADASRFFFAMIGEAHWESFGSQEQRLRAFYARPPDNVLVHSGYIGEERDYNSVIGGCDVLYAVYQDFNSSSNVLAKASGLRRKVLVAKDTLMGERVLASRIGDVAPQGNADYILAALQRLCEQPPETFDFDHYAELHSLDALKRALAEALPVWCATRP